MTAAPTPPSSCFRDVPPPPPDFDPLEDPSELGRYSLPEQPDPIRELVLHDLWREMLSPSLRFVLAHSAEEPIDRSLIEGLSLFRLNRHAARAAQHRRRTSPNWSGGFVLPGRGERFRRVAASWRVPHARPGADENPSSKLKGRCSIWIGLDGKKRWAASMPQVGTEQQHDGSARFWWQWWTPTSRRLQHYMNGVPLAAGDLVYCNLSVLDAHRVRFHVLNRTQHVFSTVEVGNEEPMWGSSAQWILERPATAYIEGGKLKAGPLYPMPDFGRAKPIQFAARAVCAGAEDRPRAYPLAGFRLTSNVTVRHDPSRSAIVSQASRGGPEERLTLAYRRRHVTPSPPPPAPAPPSASARCRS